MGTAFVFNEHLKAEDREKVDLVLEQSGYSSIYRSDYDVSSISEASDIGVVVLPVSSADEVKVASSTFLFGQAGIRIISIWLEEECDGSGLPEGIEKYGSAVVSIKSPYLTNAIVGENVVWEDSNGNARATPKTKRNEC